MSDRTNRNDRGERIETRNEPRQRNGGRGANRSEGTLARPYQVHPFELLHQEMNRLFDGFRGAAFPSFLGGDFAAANRWPNVDVSMDAERVHVECDLPGIEQKDVNVTVDGTQLVISGEIRSDTEEKGRRFTRRERTRGSFERAIALPPDVIPDQAEARFRNGVLLVDVPRQVDERSRPRKVPIEGT